MGIRLNPSEAFEKAGAGTANFLEKIAAETKKLGCKLWSKYPKPLVGGNFPSPSFVRGYLNEVCSDDPETPLPPAPASPFTGGQCQGVKYRAWVSFTRTYDHYTDNSLDKTISYNDYYADVRGPVDGLVTKTTSEGANYWAVRARNVNGDIYEAWTYRNGSLSRIAVFTSYSSGASGPSGEWNNKNVKIYRIDRLDGQADNCGSPPSNYPDVIVNNNDFTTTVNIDSGDGGDLNFTLKYAPTTLKFPMEFTLNDLDITFDLGGIDINFGPRDNNGNPEPLPDGSPHPLPEPRDYPSCPSLPKIAPPIPEDYDVDEKSPSDPKEEDVGEELEFVKIDILSVPQGGPNRIQWGDGAPDVVYSGWFEFTADGYAFPRQPIHFKQAIFRKPEGATGYAYTLYQGYIGRATIYKVKPE